jgi:pyruvate dehydrogenase E2 component (dihydrolipoamide acetyltransferase)
MEEQLAQTGPTAATGKGDVRVERPTRSQQSVARRSAESRATVPDLELSAEIDMSAAVEVGAVPPLVVRACALALREVPRANGSYRDGHYELYSRVNVGVAIVTDDSWIVPTVFDADLKRLGEIASELVALTRRAQAGELRPPELSGATFSVWYPGEHGVASSSAVIIPPQAGALAAGAVREAPVVRDGAIVPGEMMTVTLVCDHRILYGVQAATFLAGIKSRLEHPEVL